MSGRRQRVARPLAILALIAAVLPARVAATTGPTQIIVNQATANAIADLWFPSVQERAVAPDCSSIVRVDCPGGTPIDPPATLRFTRVTLAAHPVPPDRFDVATDLVVETVDPIAITASGVECTLTIDSSAGTRETVAVATGATSISNVLLGYNYLKPYDLALSGLEPADVSLQGTGFNASVCAGLGLVDVMATDVLAGQLKVMQESHGPLCGVPAPQLVATCPWLTVAPAALDFGDQAVAVESDRQQVAVSNVFPGLEYYIEIGQITIEGTNAGDFAISADTCSGADLGNWSCTLDVSFTPSAAGARTATIVIPNSWPGSPAKIPLTGAGIAAPPETADLSVAAAAALGSGKAKSRITYTIDVLNSGPSTAPAVTLTDSLAPGTTFLAVTTSAGSCTAPAPGSTGTVTCDLGTLASGVSAEIQIVATITTRKTTLTNTATVSSSVGDPDPMDDTASVVTRVK